MFENIIGQDLAVDQMKNALNRQVNTYVFYGSRGTYVEESSRLFASALLDPSGQLDEKISKGIFVDVIEFEPIGNSYRIKEDVRQAMLGEYSKSSIEGLGKVLIIHDAHLLRNDSANTLLKSLEETPEKLFWILIAPSKDSLISTIRSRAYEIEFQRLDENTIESVLVSEGVNENKARDVASKCSGRLDRARLMCSALEPLRQSARDVVNRVETSGSFVAESAQKILEAIDEISADFIATNKKELESLKKDLKESGYSDKIAKSILANYKSRSEAREKRLKNDLVKEFLDILKVEYMSRNDLSTSKDYSQNVEASVRANETINEYIKRLTFNPSDLLFIESLLASLTKSNNKVNS